ncbi:MAG: 50S ribosomal protein L24 [Candidatus Omnitrophica bacterium]|nr:50S ribosomal protein L24 [Candidatus Omnitrophota bacterium]
MSLKIKKGDKVQVLAGKDKGKTGKVLRVLSLKSRVVVEGLNIVKKHFRRRSEQETGGIKEVPAAIAISNIALFCSGCGKGAKVGINVLENKEKIRICKKCQQQI